MNRYCTSRKGFTLAELLIVVVIMGVLGSMALPKFYPQKEKAVVAEAVAMLAAIRQGELAYKLENGVYIATPTDWSVLGIDTPNNTRFTYTVVGGSPAGVTDGAGNPVYAMATRAGSGCNPTASPQVYGGCTIALNLTAGTWNGVPGSGGRHSFQPKDAP